MNYVEQTVTFDCAQETLVGILAVPQRADASTAGVIIIVGGPQYRAGSHRQFVSLSRALAAAGYPVLRFDYCGMGDSSGEQRDFLEVTPDVSAAVNAMQAKLPTIKHVALLGLCDGASAALLYCHETNDPRVSGLCLLNPWVRSAASLARTRVKHYYLQRLMQRDFWAKLLRGDVAWKALVGLANNIRIAVIDTSSLDSPALSTRKPAQNQQLFQRRMASAWDGFAGNICLILSAADYTAKEFLEYASMDAAWADRLGHPNVVRCDLPDADHTFSDTASRIQVEAVILEWLGKLTPA